jgi:hypothetical protein
VAGDRAGNSISRVLDDTDRDSTEHDLDGDTDLPPTGHQPGRSINSPT